MKSSLSTDQLYREPYGQAHCLVEARNVIKVVRKVGKFSDIACNIISCLVVGIFVPKKAW